jgi:cell division protein FtsI (penicillin-binding protein 3)
MDDRDAPPPFSAPLRPRHLGRPPAPEWRDETITLSAGELAARPLLARARRRLGVMAAGFALAFAAVTVKLAIATVIAPLRPPPPKPIVIPAPEPDAPDAAPEARIARAEITDRNGQILAISLPTAELYANPKEMIDPAQAAHQIAAAVPRLDEKEMAARLRSDKSFVYLARSLTPREELAINALGIPGLYFQPSERRHYPLGRVAAQVLGGVDVDEHGVAGIERAFDQRLRTDPAPLRLSLDLRVQAVVREELAAAMAEFQAIGACGIVMDVRTGEVLAMVSLPDYDANAFGSAPADARFNRAVTGMFEPGSTFKLQTAAMALDAGLVHIWDEFDAAQPIHIGRFTITDFEGKHRWLYLPEVLAYSSNLGAAHIALIVGAERQRAWLKAMGFFDRVGVELPEAARPLIPSAANWREATVMTVGFGHGIAVSPLHVVRGTAAIANGGILLRPTLLALAPGMAPDGVRVMQESTSLLMRKLMRLVVTEGYGKKADVPGYFVGGKTGTAEKVGAHGYKRHANVSAFVSVFPMNDPRYAVYMMLDEPHGNASTGYFSTAGQVSAPAAGRVIARIAPMLGLFPQIENAAAIEASLSIPLQPAKPARQPLTVSTPAPPPSSPLPPRPAAPLNPPRGERIHEAERPAAPVALAAYPPKPGGAE